MNILRIFYGLITALVLAAIIHIIIIILIPSFAPKNNGMQLAQEDKLWQFHPLNSLQDIPRSANKAAIKNISLDPLFAVAACQYDLAEAPVVITAQGDLPFWSVAIFDHQRNNIYSYNSRTAANRELSLVIVNPAQLAQLRKDPSLYSPEAILIESNANNGFILLRALNQDPSWHDKVQEFLNQASCEKLEL